jgi:short/branched chain acyl-CoA dehydrogenase
MFELSKEHEDFRKVVREFAEAEIEPHIAKWDKDHHFPSDLVPKMGDLGLFGLVVPEEFGGMGEDGDFTSLCVAIEELARVDSSVAVTLEAAVSLGAMPIYRFGTEEQKRVLF